MIDVPMSMSIAFRNSPQEVFLQKGVLKKCSKFTVDHPCRSLISIELFCNFIEIALQHGRCPGNLLNIFRTPFNKNISRGLLLLYALFFFMLFDSY